ncbi:cell division protein ZapB [Brucepastera parasyntrophica]|uniref:cell division protein ZapB n=1 Tax=Brucepastera parasyntrophica TaxID=2880008 RepID=UPI0021093C79|nr:cell division protein ZapB [Brucepastera parasyntrophica]ULQ60186.1 cell division protein ZapB [Brucepastera parasyntrophica]
MLSLDQVHLLENRVEKAVAKIQSLTAENTHLKSQLSGLQARVDELEAVIHSFKDDQGKIEQGILHALDRLSAFEDSITGAPAQEAGQDTPSEEEVRDNYPETAPQTDEPARTDDDTQIEIEADWQNQDNNSSPNAGSDGQMDIF